MKHARGAARKFRNAAERASWHLPHGLPAGFFMTDPARISSPEEIILALPPGIAVIVRHFGIAEEIERAGAIISLCEATSRICLIGADPDLALRTGAAGVHWPARMAADARQRAHEFAFNTMSAHDLQEIRAAERAGADAVILSTVLASSSPSAGEAIGTMRLARYAANTSLPVYGLGGVTASNAKRVARFGGFASVSGFQELVETRT